MSAVRVLAALLLAGCFSKPPPPAGVGPDAGSADGGSAVGSGFAYVQGIGSGGSGQRTDLAVAFPDGVSAGDLLIVAYDFDVGTTGVDKVSDSAGDTFTTAVAVANTQFVMKIAYAVAAQAGSDEVSLSDGAGTSNSFMDLRLLEYSGATRVDAAGSAAGHDAGEFTGPALTLSHDGDLIIGFIDADSATVRAGQGSNMTLRSDFDGDAVEDAVSTGTTFTTTGSLDGDADWTMLAAAFQP